MVTPTQDCRNSPFFRNLFIETSHKKTLFFTSVFLVLFYTCTGKDNDHDFDYFLFSQRWLPSSCISYEEKTKDSKNKCVLPDNYDYWAIHGLWPTKGGKMGPFFCNNSMKFDVNALEPIRNDLENFWPNVEEGKSTSSLWKHEWTKHGTCAAQIEAFDKEFKYFNKSLDFFKQYNLNNLFKSASVMPSDTKGWNIIDLWHIVKNSFGKNAYFTCITERNTKRPLLAEIRICFDKNLNLRHCEEVSGIHKFSDSKFSDPVTNCPYDTKVLIPNSVDAFSPQNTQKETYQTLLEILKVIKFLQWSFL